LKATKEFGKDLKAVLCREPATGFFGYMFLPPDLPGVVADISCSKRGLAGEFNATWKKEGDLFTKHLVLHKP